VGEREKDTLTKLELQMMQVIWKLGPGTVGDVQSGLEQQLAYTTVQTMLNILQKKGKLKRKLRGRAFCVQRDCDRSKSVRPCGA